MANFTNEEINEIKVRLGNAGGESETSTKINKDSMVYIESGSSANLMIPMTDFKSEATLVVHKKSLGSGEESIEEQSKEDFPEIVYIYNDEVYASGASIEASDSNILVETYLKKGNNLTKVSTLDSSSIASECTEYEVKQIQVALLALIDPNVKLPKQITDILTKELELMQSLLESGTVPAKVDMASEIAELEGIKKILLEDDSIKDDEEAVNAVNSGYEAVVNKYGKILVNDMVKTYPDYHIKVAALNKGDAEAILQKEEVPSTYRNMLSDSVTSMKDDDAIIAKYHFTPEDEYSTPTEFEVVTLQGKMIYPVFPASALLLVTQ